MIEKLRNKRVSKDVETTEGKSFEETRNTTSCVWASPDVRQAPAEAPQPTKAAKKRMRKAVKKQYGKIVTDDGGVKSIPLNGDALAKAKEADEATARRVVIDGVQADAAYLAARIEHYTELAIAEDEAKQKRIVFADTFRDPEVRKRLQNVRDFFATKKSHEYLLGKDGVTQYFTAPDYFCNECHVTYEYVRRLSKDNRFKMVTPLLTDGRGNPQPQLCDGTEGGSARGEDRTNESRNQAPKESDINPDDDWDETPSKVNPPQQEEANHAASVDEKVRSVLAYAERFARLMSVDEREEFYSKLVDKLKTEVEFPIEITPVFAAPQAEATA